MTDHVKNIKEAVESDDYELLCRACTREAITALLGELEAAKKNEARYLWLRNTSRIAAGHIGDSIALPHYETDEAQRIDLDAFIDAVIKGATP